MEKTFYIHDNWTSQNPTILGYLYVNQSRGKEICSFEFDKTWLKNNPHVFLGPDLYYDEGRQFLYDKPIFGFLSDSCPDRWGRLLIQRKEAEVAKRQNRKPKTLSEIDYLIRSSDKIRMGAIRISNKEGRFLSDTPITSIKYIRKLENIASDFFDENTKINEKSLDQLLSPGSSLGGAWPKASVIDEDNNLWIAKFPSKHDNTNREAWEMVCHDIAKMCNINVPESKVENFSKYGSTYLSKRFDRSRDRRIHFASAMTLLGKQDGDSTSSYLDIVSIIKAHGSNPINDLKELYARLIFNACVSNTDDHLRNHGFLLEKNGWKLSPAYDVNPSPYGNELSLFINQNDRTINKESILSINKYFGLDNTQAENLFVNIAKTIKNNWESTAKKYNITNKQINDMQPAFSLCYAD